MKKKMRLHVCSRHYGRFSYLGELCGEFAGMEETPTVERWDYEEIVITGGEPLDFYGDTKHLVQAIKDVNAASGVKTKFRVATMHTGENFINILDYVDGVMLKIDNLDAAKGFRKLNTLVLQKHYKFASRELDLLIEEKYMDFLPDNMNAWTVRKDASFADMLPKDEYDERRVAELWMERKHIW